MYPPKINSEPKKLDTLNELGSISGNPKMFFPK